MYQPSKLPRAAIAIACYNQGHFLSQAIDSAIKQTRTPDEIIVVDDGSSDNTAEVASTYPQVRYFRQANGGLSSARNTALAITSCDHILFLDADDTLEPDTIALGLASLQTNPEAAFVYGGYREIDGIGNMLFERMANHVCRSYEGLLTGNHIVMHGTVLYRTGPLRAIGGFDICLPSCEDYDVYLKLSRKHRIDSYQYIAANYRRHGSNMTRNAIKMLQASKLVLNRQKPYIKGQPHLLIALGKGKHHFETYYGMALARSILAGILSPNTLMQSFFLFSSGMKYSPRLLLWMARAFADKMTRGVKLFFSR